MNVNTHLMNYIFLQYYNSKHNRHIINSFSQPNYKSFAQDNNTTAVSCQTLLYSFFFIVPYRIQSTKLTRIQFAQTIHNSRKEAIVVLQRLAGLSQQGSIRGHTTKRQQLQKLLQSHLTTTAFVSCPSKLYPSLVSVQQLYSNLNSYILQAEAKTGGGSLPKVPNPLNF